MMFATYPNQPSSLTVERQITNKLHSALSLLQSGDKISGKNQADEVLALASDCPQFSLPETLHMRGEISGAFYQAGLTKQAAELDQEIEACLGDLSDDDDRSSLHDGIVARRKKIDEGGRSDLRHGVALRSKQKEEEDRSALRSGVAVCRRQRAEVIRVPNSSDSPDRRPLAIFASQELAPAPVYSVNAGNVAKNCGLAYDYGLGHGRNESIRTLGNEMNQLPATGDTEYAQSSTGLSQQGRFNVPLPTSRSCNSSGPARRGLGSDAEDVETRPPVNPQHASNKDLGDNTPATFGSTQFASNNLNTPEGKADEWFNRLFTETHAFIRGPMDNFQREPYKKVRVAVLDTGFRNRSHADKSLTQSFSGKVAKAISCFADHRRGDEDEDGHGTDVLFQLSRVCPSAVLYSYRVAQRVEGTLVADKAAVLKALGQAVKDKIEIVNMSFGWPYDDKEVKRALQNMQDDHGILFFASVSNYGALGDRNILFPASSAAVIAVDAADGIGHPAPNNSSTVVGDVKARFSAPGITVPGVVHSRVNGTSFASPIAAGIAALVLEFARQSPLTGDNTIEYLRMKDGMEIIFKMIQIQKTSEPFMFLSPWMLFGDPSGQCGGSGRSGSERYYVAYKIMNEMRKRFGYDKGIGSNFEDN